MSRKISISFFVFLVLLIAGVVALHEQEKRPLRLALHPWIGSSTLRLAAEAGCFNHEPLELVPTASLSESAKALATGRVDGAALTLDEVLCLRAQGIDLAVVLVFDFSAGADVLLAKKELTSLSSLKGKCIGLENSVLSALMLSEILLRGKLKSTEITLVHAPVKDHEMLWSSGRVDALISYLPLPENLLREGVILFDSKKIPETIFDVLTVRRKRAEALQKTLTRIIRCHFTFLQKMRLRDPDTIYRLAPFLQASPLDIRFTLGKLVLPGLLYNQRLLTGETPQFTVQAKKVHHLMREAKIIENTASLQDLIYSAPLRASLRP